MDNTVIQKIQEVLEKNESIDIVIGKNPRTDEMAAALSLYLSLQAAGKKVAIASPSVPTVEISSLVGINKVQTQLSKTGSDLVVSFPYKDKEIQKVSYTLEEGYLNIVVKAGPSGLSFSDKDVMFKHAGDGASGSKVLFVIGTPRLSDLGPLFDPEALKETTVINIDNKQHNQGFGDIIFVSSKFSSVSEQIGSVIKQLNLPLDVDVAQNLLSGISHMTDNFQKPNTSFYAFEMAGFLMKKGAQREKAARREQKQFPQETKDAMSAFAPASASSSASAPAQAPMNASQTHQQPQFHTQPQAPRHQPRSNFTPKPMPQQFMDDFDDDFASKDNPFFTPAPASAPTQAPKKEEPKEDFQDNRPVAPKSDKPAPSDWLTPKIYKGSSEV